MEQIVDAGGRFSLGFEAVYNDNGDDLMGPDRPFHVRIDVDGTPDAEGYTVSVENSMIVWQQTRTAAPLRLSAKPQAAIESKYRYTDFKSALEH